MVGNIGVRVAILMTILLAVVQADDDELSPSYPPVPYPLFSTVDKVHLECIKQCEIYCLAVPERLSPLCVRLLTVIKCWHPLRDDLSAAIKTCLLRCLPPMKTHSPINPVGRLEAFAANCFNKCDGKNQ